MTHDNLTHLGLQILPVDASRGLTRTIVNKMTVKRAQIRYLSEKYALFGRDKAMLLFQATLQVRVLMLDAGLAE